MRFQQGCCTCCAAGDPEPHRDDFDKGAVGQDVHKDGGHHHHAAVPQPDPVPEGAARRGRGSKGHRRVRPMLFCRNAALQTPLVPGNGELTSVARAAPCHCGRLHAHALEARAVLVGQRVSCGCGPLGATLLTLRCARTMQASKGGGQPRPRGGSWEDRLVSARQRSHEAVPDLRLESVCFVLGCCGKPC